MLAIRRIGERVPSAGTAIQGVHTSPLATYHDKTILQANVSFAKALSLLFGSLRNAHSGEACDYRCGATRRRVRPLAITANQFAGTGSTARIAQDVIIRSCGRGITRLSVCNQTFLAWF